MGDMRGRKGAWMMMMSWGGGKTSWVGWFGWC
jgi:hypothetical protein